MIQCARGHGRAPILHGCLHVMEALAKDRPIRIVCVTAEGLGTMPICQECESVLAGMPAEGDARHNYIGDVITRYDCFCCYKAWTARHGLVAADSTRVGFVEFSGVFD